MAEGNTIWTDFVNKLSSTSLRDYAKNKGYSVEYNDKNKQVKLTNPNNNYSIQFESGKGEEYGLGGLLGGTNVVKDTAKLDQALSKKPNEYNIAMPKTESLSNLLSSNNQPINQNNQSNQNIKNTDYTTNLLNQLQQKTDLGIKPSTEIYNTRSQQIEDMYKTLQESQLTQAKLAREKEALGLSQGKYDVNMAYENTLGQLGQERSQATPQYENLRSQQVRTALQNLAGINETKANQGQYAGGANIQAQLAQRTSSEQAINDINLQEQQLYDDINRRATEAYNTKVNEIKKIDENLGLLQSQGATSDNALVQQLQAQKLQSQIDLQNTLDSRDLQIAQLQQSAEQSRVSNLLQGLQLQQSKEQQAQDLALQEAQLTGNYNGQQTLSAQELSNTIQQQAKENAMQQAQLTGTYISPTQQSIINQGVSQEDTQRINSIVANLAGGYQEYINTLDPNTDEYTKAQVLRNQKLLSNQDLANKYGLSQYGTQTLEGKTTGLQNLLTQQEINKASTENQYLAKQLEANLTSTQLQNIGQELSNKLDTINIDYLPQEKQLAIDTAKIQMQAGQLENAYQTIINANLPDKLTAELNATMADIEGTYSNIANTNIDTALKTNEAIGSGATGLINYAKQFEGTKYVWGGNDLKKGIDCSGLTQQVFQQYGIDLPRTTYEQVKKGKEVSKNNLQPGDLVFFNTSDKNGHVGIYVGNGQMIHASSSKGITTTPIDSDYWKSRYSTARRVINQ